MFNESINYLRKSDELYKTVFIGGILTLLGFLLVPTFTVVGYVVRVLRRTSRGDEEPPVFTDVDDAIEMTVEGFKGFVVAFVYSLVPLVVAGVLVGGSIVSLIAGGGGNSGGLVGLGLGGLLLGGLVALVLGLAAAYVIPAALANFADAGSIGAGFDFDVLRPVLTSSTYARGWLVGLAVVIVGGILLSVLSIVPLLGTVLGVFVQFYFLVAAYYVIGRTWGELRDVAPVGDGDSPSEQAAV
jgi:hypothetical protein